MFFSEKVSKYRLMPGFGLSMGITLLYLSLIIVFPICMIFSNLLSTPWEKIIEILSSARVLAAFKLTFGLSLLAALTNAIFGTIVAWILVCYRFPGRKLIDLMVDLPFALPTAVAGIALTSMYSKNGVFGKTLAEFGIKVAFTQFGIFLALVFVGLPFVVRSVQPLLQSLSAEIEGAALSLGANRLQLFRLVILPSIAPGIISGFCAAFGRGLGEYGTLVFISGNIPHKTEVIPLLIMNRLETFDYQSANLLAIVTLLLAFVVIFIFNYLQTRIFSAQRKSA